MSLKVTPEDEVDPKVLDIIKELVSLFETLSQMIVVASGGDANFRDFLVGSAIGGIIRRACGAGVIVDPPAFLDLMKETVAKDAMERLARKFQMS